MSGIRDLAKGRGASTYMVPLNKLTVDPQLNVRQDYGDVVGLAQDINQQGLQYPLIVYYDQDKDIAVISDGHRRFKAIQHIVEKIDKTQFSPGVECLIEPRGTNEQNRVVRMFSAGAHSKPLTPTEQATAVKRLIDSKWSVSTIAEKLGKSVAVINGLIELNGAPSDVRQAVDDKKISPTAARKLSKAPKEERAEILSKASSSGKRVRIREVEKKTKGTPSMISAKSIKDLITRVKKAIKATQDKVSITHWESVVDGLEYALGIRELPKGF